MSYFYAGPEHWDRVAAALLRSSDRGDTVGFDTEFYGVGEGYPTYDVRKESPAGGRTRVHMWSVAIKRHPHSLHPRGYHVTDAAVLLADAFEHRGLREWLESPAPKVAHNLSVDHHACRNSGVVLGGTVDSLNLARWVAPERARGRGFSLDSLGIDLFGFGKAADFDEVFSEEVEQVVRVKQVRTKVCECRVVGCRKRKGHAKTEVVSEEPVVKKVRVRIPLETVVPGHRKWNEALAYSARDAVLASAVHDWVVRMMARPIIWPWRGADAGT